MSLPDLPLLLLAKSSLVYLCISFHPTETKSWQLLLVESQVSGGCDQLTECVFFVTMSLRFSDSARFSTSSSLICGALRDLVPFVQFRKREKHPRTSVYFSNLLKVTLFHGCFSRFLNSIHVTISHNAPHFISPGYL